MKAKIVTILAGIINKKLTTVFIVLPILVCGGSGFAAPSDPAIKELYQAAKTEGRVIYQVPHAESIMKPLNDAFQAKYPDIKISIFSYSSGRMGTRIITEARAGKLTLDVAITRPQYCLPLLERDLLLKYDWTRLGVPSEEILLDGSFVSMYENPYVWMRNKNLVSEAQQPKTWEDVLDPRWKGFKIILRSSVTTFAPLFPIWKKDRQKAVDYLERLKKQETIPSARVVEMVIKVATGEVPIGRPSLGTMLDRMKVGAPLAICPIDPTADFPYGAVVPKGVPHPNAAKFFIAWLGSPEGKDAWGKIGYGLASPPEASYLARVLADNNIKYIRLSTVEDVLLFEGEFSKMVLNIMGWKPE